MRLDEKLRIRADERIDGKLYAELWRGFAFDLTDVAFESGERLEAVCGKRSEIELCDGEEFAFVVTDGGFTVKGRDADGLRRGLCALAARIEADERGAFIPDGEVRGRFESNFRAVHICVFPETSYFEFRRALRACGALCYTHVAVEFWGTLRFECLPELGFENAFSKDEVALAVREANALGVEIIPDFNHLGHAAQCRFVGGKHVVLDQNPRLARLFTPDGWAWRTDSDECVRLLRSVRAELGELCGDGDYFHIGCDEADIYNAGYRSRDEVETFVANVCDEVVSEGRRPMIWSDMLVPARFNGEWDIDNYVPTPADEKAVESFASRLPRETVIADWWYEVKTAPVTTCERLKPLGFDVVGCPWESEENISAYRKTDGLKGVMLTTWHTLHSHYHNLIYYARAYGYPHNEWSKFSQSRGEVARILRAVLPPSSYEQAGFCADQFKKILW